MKQLRILSAVCAFSLSMAQVKAEDQFLVDEGKAYAEIIISESPARSTRWAAAELQTYVVKNSGARLPIRAEPYADVPVQIYVVESPHAAKLGVTADHFEHGVYRIASGEKWLALIGDDTDFTPKEPWAKNNSGRGAKLQGEWEAACGLPFGVPKGVSRGGAAAKKQLLAIESQMSPDQIVSAKKAAKEISARLTKLQNTDDTSGAHEE